MASRGALGALNPTATFFNSNSGVVHDFLPPSKKRKLSDAVEASGRAGTSSFTIREQSSAGKLFNLDSITLLPRSRLPLSWLDLSSNKSRIPAGRLFVTSIPTLEEDLRVRDDPVVLAARAAADGSLYVVERVKRGIYAVCGLGDWVEEGDLLVAAKGWRDSKVLLGSAARDSPQPQAAIKREETNWWDAAKIRHDVPQYDPTEKRSKLNVSMVFGHKSMSSSKPLEVSTAPGSPQVLDTKEGREGDALPVFNTESNRAGIGASMSPRGQNASEQAIAAELEITPAAQSPQEVLDSLRAHYLEALYVSKTSVGYFAKGPLSRSRGAFQSNEQDSDMQPLHLAAFYRDSILPVKKMDLKYRESIPKIVESILPALSGDEDDTNAQSKKKRKNKKNKLGKDAMYPGENELVSKWWTNRSLKESSLPTGSSREAEMRRFIGDLRLRETQLQILLILETVALEGSATEAPLPQLESEKQEGKPAKRSGGKKPQDLKVLLELLLDRLCIWHAVSFDEVLPGAGIARNHLSSKKVEHDELRDFCTEVIIPFYASRLPEQCKAISRKLGGPSAISPARPRPSHTKSQPGAAVERGPPQKKPRTLHRVLTDEKTAPSSRAKTPSLLRSNTAPTALEAKRESAEPSLLPPKSSVRGGIQSSKRGEVDLDALARQHEAKIRKMNRLVEQKKELDAAINTLRKPNRELVAKEIVDTAEQRSTSARKSKNPVRNPLGQGVQVMATPRKARKSDVVGLPPLPRSVSRATGRQSIQSSPSDTVIPSSSNRPGPASSSLQRSSDMHSVHDTPTRGSSKLSNPLRLDAEGDGEPDLPPNRMSRLFKVPGAPAPRLSPPRSHPQLQPQSQPRSQPPSTPTKGSTPAPSQPQRQANGYGDVVATATVPGTGLSGPSRSMQALTPVAKSKPPRARADSPIFETPVKTNAGIAPAVSTAEDTVCETPEKSIYTSLGWDDGDDDDNDMV